MDGEEEISVGWGRGRSHGRARQLQPECVTELEHVVPHDDGEGFDEGGSGDMLASAASLVDVLGDFDESLARVDVSIHRSCIRGEDTTTNREW